MLEPLHAGARTGPYNYVQWAPNLNDDQLAADPRAYLVRYTSTDSAPTRPYFGFTQTR